MKKTQKKYVWRQGRDGYCYYQNQAGGVGHVHPVRDPVTRRRTGYLASTSKLTVVMVLRRQALKAVELSVSVRR